MCPVASKHGVVISQPLSMQATEIISRHQSFLSLAFWHHDSRCFSLGSCAFLRFLENAAWWHGGFLLSCADTPISGAGRISVRRRYADIRGWGDIGAAPIRRYPGLGGYRCGADTPISGAGGISTRRRYADIQGWGDIGVSVYRCGAGAGGYRCIGVSVRRRGWRDIGVSVRWRGLSVYRCVGAEEGAWDICEYRCIGAAQDMAR